MLSRLRQHARALKRDTYALWLAYHDPRTPWYTRIVTACVVAYAFSPIDLIPDFMPVFGYLDDLILVPLGIMLAVRLIPSAVLDECRTRAQDITERPTSRTAALVIITIWILAALLSIWWLAQLLRW